MVNQHILQGYCRYPAACLSHHTNTCLYNLSCAQDPKNLLSSCSTPCAKGNNSIPAVQASFLMQRPVGNRFLIQPLEPNEPAKDCMVCGTAQLQLTLNTAAMTLAQFVNKVHMHFGRELPARSASVQCCVEEPSDCLPPCSSKGTYSCKCTPYGLQMGSV